MFANFLKQLFKDILNIAGSVATLISAGTGIYTEYVLKKNLVIASEWYWILSLLLFLLVNYRIYISQEKKIEDYKSKEARLAIKFKKASMCIRYTDNIWQNFDNNPRPETLGFGGAPGNIYISVPNEIENAGTKFGKPICEIILEKCELPELFTFDPASLPHGYFSSNESNGWIGPGKPVFPYWCVDVFENSSKTHKYDFTKQLHELSVFKLVVRYKTERMDQTESEYSEPIAIYGDFDTLKLDLLSLWKKKQGMEDIVEFYSKLG
jgi:hypothetical protein